MRSIFKLSMIGFFLFALVGCEKNEIQTDMHNDYVTVPNTKLYMVDMLQPSAEVLVVSTDQINAMNKRPGQRALASDISFRAAGKNASAQGIITTQMGSKANVSAMRNPSGMHGSNKIVGPTFFSNIKFDSDCIFKVDNQAHIGGTITHWEADTAQMPPGFPPVDVGWSLYFAVSDSGQGKNSPPDGYGAIFIAPPTDTAGVPIPPLCESVYNAYQAFGVPFLAGQKPTNIVVK